MSANNGKKKLLLIDGTAQIYRAFYGIRPLTDSKGEPVNAVYGFASMILNVLKQTDPTHIIVVFDRPEPTHRHKLFENYKAQRQSPPEDLIKQIPVIKKMTEVLGWNVCEKAGFEADDVISTLAMAAASDNADVLILTSDKDMFQIVNEKIMILKPSKGGQGGYEKLDESGVEQVFGVLPHQVTDVLALMGDTSDNIPGVPGIGPKTAMELVREYKSLHEIYRNLDKIKRNKLKDNLEQNRDKAMQSYALVQVIKDVPLERKWYECVVGKDIPDEAVRLLTDLGFKRLLGMLPAGTAASSGTGEWSKDMEDGGDVSELCRMAAENKHLALEIFGDKLILAADNKKSSSIVIGDRGAGLVLMEYPFLVSCITDVNIKKISYDFKPIYIACKRAGITPGGKIVDLHLAAHLLDMPSNSMIRFMERVIGETTDVIQSGFWACALLSVADNIMAKLDDDNVLNIYNDIEVPLLPVLGDMENSGVAIDVDRLNEMAAEFGIQMEILEKEIQNEAGMEFNIRSPQQLGEVLFDHLQLKAGKKTKTGRSTSVEILEELAAWHPLPGKVLEYRKLQKIKSTYLDVLPTLLSDDDHRLHTTFHQVGAATGRLSSTDPNLQNIPVRSEVGRKIRDMFIPGPKGDRLLSADYSQIELRLLAHLSGDEQMIMDFNEGLDIHQATAAELFDVELENVTQDMRRQAKTCNFGIAYGVSPFGLAKQIGVNPYRAKEFIDGFYNRYPGVRLYLDGMLAEARKKGFVTTISGRKRVVPDINSANRNIREAAERMAINTPVQGSAADMIKLAMIRMAEGLRKENLQSYMILQVHDELLFEGPEDEMEKLKDLAIDIMQNVCLLKVPLVVEAAYGGSWMEAHS